MAASNSRVPKWDPDFGNSPLGLGLRLYRESYGSRNIHGKRGRQAGDGSWWFMGSK